MILVMGGAHRFAKIRGSSLCCSCNLAQDISLSSRKALSTLELLIPSCN